MCTRNAVRRRWRCRGAWWLWRCCSALASFNLVSAVQAIFRPPALVGRLGRRPILPGGRFLSLGRKAGGPLAGVFANSRANAPRQAWAERPMPELRNFVCAQLLFFYQACQKNGDRKSPQMCSGLTPTPQKNRAPIRRLNWEGRRASGNRAVGRSSRKQVSSADANSTAAVCPAPCGTQMAVAMCPGGTDPGRRVQALLPHARCARRHCDPAETAQGRHVKQLRST